MSFEIKDLIIDKCMEVLKRKDVKEELKNLMRPMINMLIKEIYPYIFLSIVILFTIFLLIFEIFIFLFRSKIYFKVIHK